MNLEKDDSFTTNEDRQKQLRQLEHDMKTYLGVVSMGLQALSGVLEVPDEFAELCNTIEEEGVKPLKQIVAEIVTVALQEQD